MKTLDRPPPVDPFPPPLRPELCIRRATPDDLAGMVALSRAVYGERGSWRAHELSLHQEIFPQGQLVAEDPVSRQVVGKVISLVVDSTLWPTHAPWRDVTDRGRLTTHDWGGDTLYGAGVAVHPEAQGMGVAKQLYRAREALRQRLHLRAIRAGARIPGYGEVADQLSPEDYVAEVVAGLRSDPTLSFQLHLGFRVIGVARNYLVTDHESRTHAAIVEYRPKRPAPGAR